MSYSVIQVGHCGNRLGHSFFTTIAEITCKKPSNKNYEFLDKSDSRFFTYNEKEDKKHAHAILLDTDSEVFQDVTKPTKNSWSYGSECCKLFKKLEPLSSWTQGYKVYGPSLREFILDSVRKEVECYDQFYGFLMFGSMSGFTSSGVGSYITKLLRDEFPSVSLANISVCPFLVGSGGPQFYNAILNLSTLQNFSDAIFLIENDYLMNLTMQKLGMEDASLIDYNLIASHQLANLLLPVDNYCSTLNDMLSLLVPHPQFKMINMQSVPQEPLSSLPFCSYDWSTLFRSLRRVLLYSTDVDKVYGSKSSPSPITSVPVSLTNLLILRGRDCTSADINYFHKPQFPYASWVPRSSRMNIWTHSNPFLSCDKTALLANNGQLSMRYVDKMTQYAWQCFAHKSYFYHFEEQGLTKEDFYLSFLDAQQIVSSYKSLKT